MSNVSNNGDFVNYYTHSQKDKVGFHQLSEDINVDVCVVGGGLSGVATAVELCEKGYKVALLEANQIGWGASGRNGGHISGGYGESLKGSYKSIEKNLGVGANEALWQMGIECVDIIKQRVAKYNIDCDLKWGHLSAAIKPREMKGLVERHQELVNKGYPHKLTLVDKAGVKEVVGTDRYIGGMINEGFGHVHVLDLCKGEARVAESLGAKIFEKSLATSIERGEKARVNTEHGSVTADYVVLCGNAYLGDISPNLAPKLSPYVLPASSYLIATEPLSDKLAADIMRKDFAIRDQRTALDYYRMSADKRLVFGGMANYTARDPRSIVGAMRPKMLKVFPQLRHVKIDFEWGGNMGIGMNRVPQLGRLEDNIFYVQAYAGHGVAPSHLSARLLAEVISNQAERFDIMARIKHSPFPGGRVFRQPLLALGMMYYKLLDEIA